MRSRLWRAGALRDHLRDPGLLRLKPIRDDRKIQCLDVYASRRYLGDGDNCVRWRYALTNVVYAWREDDRVTAKLQCSSAGFVLAGGKSSRLGSDKAFLKLGGRTLLERAIEVMREACDEVAVVGDAAKFSNYGIAVPDRYPGCGPLAGIHAALLHSSAELNLIMAVDMPFVSRELLTFLLITAAASEAMVVVPRVGGRSQPLCAVYRRPFAALAEEALRTGKYKIDASFDGVAVRVIGEEELGRAGFSERMFFNVNTTDDLRAAQAER
jgi:molybdopterin-guanine dinucleotide biosynthesis protein A